MDYRLSQSLDHFSAAHDRFEDMLGAYVGSAEILFIAIIVLLFVAVPGKWRQVAQRAAVAAAASAGLALLAGHFISAAVNRPRPFVAHPESIHPFLAHTADPSFPSDHATAAFAIAVAIALRRRSWGLVMLVLATVLAAGRVFLGLHYPSDVIGGALLGSLTALALNFGPPRRLLDGVADKTGEILDGTFDRLRRRPSAPVDRAV